MGWLEMLEIDDVSIVRRVVRHRRLRRREALRDLVKETYVDTSSLVYPIFVKEGIEKLEDIPTMRGIARYPVEDAVNEVAEAREAGIKSFLVFGIPMNKDDRGSEAYNRNGIVQRLVRRIRENIGDSVVIITDVCLCQYTSHGHCGLVKNGYVDNDATLELLSLTALSHAEAGADIVAPSAMMDHQVGAIREALDKEGFTDIAIMGYSAKYASVFYGPFRDAAYSAPKFGDRRAYQMDVRNRREALREIEEDVKEGADIVMVKPALAYLDVISAAKRAFNTPLAAYNVSGEYAMIKAASELGVFDEKQAVYEVLTAIRRAGADLIITYFAKTFAEWRKRGEIP